ncbi:hypothetical protein L9F63_002929, partial [Diploptera punctata]
LDAITFYYSKIIPMSTLSNVIRVKLDNSDADQISDLSSCTRVYTSLDLYVSEKRNTLDLSWNFFNFNIIVPIKHNFASSKKIEYWRRFSKVTSATKIIIVLVFRNSTVFNEYLFFKLIFFLAKKYDNIHIATFTLPVLVILIYLLLIKVV